MKLTLFLPLVAVAFSCFPSAAASQEVSRESDVPDIRMYFQEFQPIEGVTSPIPTVVGDGPLQVYTHAKPALVVTPEHVRSIQLMYYDELATIKIRFTEEATEKMVSSLRGLEGKRLITGIVDGKANGNQAFSGDSFTMEFFFHSLDEAVKIVKTYEKTSENKDQGKSPKSCPGRRPRRGRFFANQR